MSNLFRHFLSDECGATAIEYGLIAAGIAVVINRRRERSGHEPEHDIQQHSSQLK